MFGADHAANHLRRHLLETWGEHPFGLSITYLLISIFLVRDLLIIKLAIASNEQCVSLAACMHAQVCFAGLMSGLTLGLMSMDIVELEVLRRSGSEKEARQAERIIPLLRNAHFLLVRTWASLSQGCRHDFW